MDIIIRKHGVTAVCPLFYATVGDVHENLYCRKAKLQKRDRNLLPCGPPRMATPRTVRLGCPLGPDDFIRHAEIIRVLLAAGADVNGSRGTQGRDSPVCAAALDAHLHATSEAPAGRPAWLEDYLQREGYKVLNDARSRGGLAGKITAWLM